VVKLGQLITELTMPHLKIAHMRQQGQNMIIVPLDDDFGHKSNTDRQHAIRELQARSRSAGLAGTVVPVWNDGGCMAFIAPRPWHPFFSSLDLPTVWANVNKELSW
jgi:hypothetical protein